MVDQDQDTSNNDQPNSVDQTNTSTEGAQGSDTSTTDNQDKIDLADDAAADGSSNDDDQQQDTRTDEEKAADAERAELFGAPAEGETYKIEGLPEGMGIDQEALEAVTPTFRELGLSDKGASKVAQVYAEKVLPQVMDGAVKKIEADVLAQRSAWEGEAAAAVKSNGQELKNAAGEPLSFDAKDMAAVRATAAKALDRLAPAGFREFLQNSGLSVHPAMVAFCYQAGKNIAEDRDLETTETGGAQKQGGATRNTGGMDPNRFYGR